MFSRETKYLLVFCKMCGFNPKPFEQSKISLLILTVHIIWACYSTYSVTEFLIKRFHKKETLHFVNSFVQFSSALLAYWMIIIESFGQQNLSLVCLSLLNKTMPKSCILLLVLFGIDQL